MVKEMGLLTMSTEFAAKRKSVVLDDALTQTLRLCDRRLRRLVGGEPARLYAVARRSVAAIVPSSIFIIGWYESCSTASFPYVFRDNEVEPPEVLSFGPFGLLKHLRAQGTVYRLAQDNGRLLGGDFTLLAGYNSPESHDVVAVPLVGPGQETIGLCVVASEQPHVFDDSIEWAIRWIASALMIALSGGLAESRCQLYADFPALDSMKATCLLDLAHDVVWGLEAVSELIPRIQSALRCGNTGEVEGLLLRLASEKNSLASRTLEIARAAKQSDPLGILTVREREIASLIADKQFSNREVAQLLTISEKTVKAHVGAIFKKMGLHQREAIGWTVRNGI